MSTAGARIDASELSGRHETATKYGNSEAMSYHHYSATSAPRASTISSVSDSSRHHGGISLQRDINKQVRSPLPTPIYARTSCKPLRRAWENIQWAASQSCLQPTAANAAESTCSI
jgi:hypothetical protein